jgi:mRNA interferase MazF
MQKGEIWWASMRVPRGSEPGYRRPVLVVQSDAFNRSRINTVLAVALTGNVELARAPGNVLLSRKSTGLPRQSVANVSQIVTLDRSLLTKRVRRLPVRDFAAVEAGLRIVLDLT